MRGGSYALPLYSSSPMRRIVALRERAGHPGEIEDELPSTVFVQV